MGCVGPDSQRGANVARRVQESHRVLQYGESVQAVRSVAGKARSGFEQRDAPDDGAIAPEELAQIFQAIIDSPVARTWPNPCGREITMRFRLSLFALYSASSALRISVSASRPAHSALFATPMLMVIGPAQL